MPPRFRFPLSLQMLLAILLGALTGATMASRTLGDFGLVVLLACDLMGSIFLTASRAVAWPLVVSSIVLGVVGLEPMRGLGRLIWKTLGWVAFSSLLATLAGWAAASLVPSSYRWVGFLDGRAEWKKIMVEGGWDFRHVYPWFAHPIWLGLVLVSLAFGFYRNQIEEGHARLLARFCQGLDEMLTPFIRWAARLAPLGAFALVASLTARQAGGVASMVLRFSLPWLTAILTGWAVYGLLAMPFLLWLLTRLNPWQYMRAVAPAALLALACGSPEATLPLTFDRVRRVAGISNRVASVTLPLCGALQRDGLALAWMAVIGSVNSHLNFSHGREAALAWLLGCGGGMVPFNAAKLGPPSLLDERLDMSNTSWVQIFICGTAAWLLLMGVAAISVWSHACIAAIIAWSEGERNLLSSALPKDPLAFNDGPADGAL